MTEYSTHDGQTIGIAAKPGPVDAELLLSSHLKSMVNVLSVALLLLLVFAFGLWFTMNEAITRLETEPRLVYVKMSPDGSWAVSRDFGPDIDFFVTTVESVLKRYVTKRYSRDRNTILNNWGVAAAMMSDPLNESFMLDAKEQAAEFIAGSEPDENVRIRTYKHLDFIPSTSDEGQGLYSTLVFADREYSDGGDVNRSERVIIELRWKFMTRSQIQAVPEMIEHNPIGLQIVYNDLTLDSN